MKTLQAFLPSISTSLAPVRGSQLHLAINRAVALLQQAGKTQGQIVLFTDSNVSSQDIEASEAASDSGFVVSVVGVGTRNGAPLRDENGNFVRNTEGDVVVPKLNMDELSRLTYPARGVSSVITANSSDIQSLVELSNLQVRDENGTAENTDPSVKHNGGNTLDNTGQDRVSDFWVEHLVWVLPVFLLMALGFFRKGLAL